MLLLYFGPVRGCEYAAARVTHPLAHTQEFARIFLFSSCNDKKRGGGGLRQSQGEAEQEDPTTLFIVEVSGCSQLA
jgi:hypothetical protein